jgi:hypothetical protein
MWLTRSDETYNDKWNDLENKQYNVSSIIFAYIDDIKGKEIERNQVTMQYEKYWL